jgi:hypothetical protein
MKLKKTLLTTVLLTLFVSSYSQQKAKSICVAFYNFENYFDTINNPEIYDDDYTPEGNMGNTAKVFNQKTTNLAQVVSKIGTELTPDGPALLGVSEIENIDVLLHFAQHPLLSARNYKPIHFDSKDARGIDVALLYNPNYFIPIQSTSLEVSMPNEKSGKPYYTRDILWTTGILDGDTTHIFVNHWPSRRGGEKKSSPKREAAAAVAKHIIDSIMETNIESRVILMGDLNDDPTNKSIKKVLNVSYEKDTTAQGKLFNPFYDFYIKGSGTLAYQDAWNLFDQIIVSEAYINPKTNSYQFYKAGIFKPPFIIEQEGRYKGYPKRSFAGGKFNNGYSDHFPSYIFLIKRLNLQND